MTRVWAAPSIRYCTLPLLHPVNLRTIRASSNETAGKWTKSWYRLPFCQTLSLKPPNYISNHGFRSSEWWDIMRCPMVSMEEIARHRNAHMLPTTMNQRSSACVWQRDPWQFHFTATSKQNTLPRRKGSHIAVPVSGLTWFSFHTRKPIACLS